MDFHMRSKRLKRSFTLLELMIVICIIGLITGVVGYNMKGSLQKGKKFKTEQAMDQVRDILELQIAEGAISSDVAANPETYLEKSGLAKDPKKLLKDGWGKNFDITVDENGVSVRSENYDKFFPEDTSKDKT